MTIVGDISSEGIAVPYSERFQLLKECLELVITDLVYDSATIGGDHVQFRRVFLNQFRYERARLLCQVTKDPNLVAKPEISKGPGKALVHSTVIADMDGRSLCVLYRFHDALVSGSYLTAFRPKSLIDEIATNMEARCTLL
ncbi:hypothetical protein OAG52_05215, partial [Verrucomicrobia bacterium]|nr:hypothetical protein [Verrucomicrobiota bacterium]